LVVIELSLPPAFAGFAAFAAGFAALAAAGVTLLGAALPNAGFAASLERCAVAGPAPAFDCVALPVALAVVDAGFLALVAIGFPHYTHAVSAITGGNY
jgi:hypothetical protein